jgi:hypothetical protein
MKETIEFIDHKEEQSEIKKGLFRELLDGTLLTREVVIKQLPFLVFLTFLTMAYIANRYNAEKVVRETVTIQNELKKLRAESVSIAAELMEISRQSTVVKMVLEKNLGLKESLEPPKRLIIY